MAAQITSLLFDDNFSEPSKEDLANEIERLKKELNSLQRNDPLTGLLDFKKYSKYPAFRLEIAQRIQQSLRAKSHVALFYIDLDGFKSVNDQISHDAGDLVLTTFSRCLSKAFRQEDLKFRDGGGSDEFVAILFNLNIREKDYALRLVKKLSSSFKKELSESLPEATNMVAFSVGAVGIADLDLAEARSRADSLLKKAKEDHIYKSKFLRFKAPKIIAGRNSLVLEHQPWKRYKIENNDKLKFSSR